MYYEDQSTWGVAEWYTLWRYFNRLGQFVGPNQAQQSRPQTLNAQIQTKRTGRRDEELAALEISRMSRETQHLLKHILLIQGRFEIALEKFPNLEPLREAVPPVDVIVLADPPGLYYDDFTKAGILL